MIQIVGESHGQGTDSAFGQTLHHRNDVVGIADYRHSAVTAARAPAESLEPFRRYAGPIKAAAHDHIFHRFPVGVLHRIVLKILLRLLLRGAADDGNIGKDTNVPVVGRGHRLEL